MVPGIGDVQQIVYSLSWRCSSPLKKTTSDVVERRFRGRRNQATKFTSRTYRSELEYAMTVYVALPSHLPGTIRGHGTLRQILCRRREMRKNCSRSLVNLSNLGSDTLLTVLAYFGMGYIGRNVLRGGKGKEFLRLSKSRKKTSFWAVCSIRLIITFHMELGRLDLHSR